MGVMLGEMTYKQEEVMVRGCRPRKCTKPREAGNTALPRRRKHVPKHKLDNTLPLPEDPDHPVVTHPRETTEVAEMAATGAILKEIHGTVRTDTGHHQVAGATQAVETDLNMGPKHRTKMIIELGKSGGRTDLLGGTQGKDQKTNPMTATAATKLTKTC